MHNSHWLAWLPGTVCGISYALLLLLVIMHFVAGDSADQPQCPLQDRTAVVLGTGGAARALAFGAAARGANVLVAGRTAVKVKALAEAVDATCTCTVKACDIAEVQAGELPAMDVVLNTTPLGMVGAQEQETPVPQEVLAKARFAGFAVPRCVALCWLLGYNSWRRQVSAQLCARAHCVGSLPCAC